MAATSIRTRSRRASPSAMPTASSWARPRSRSSARSKRRSCSPTRSTCPRPRPASIEWTLKQPGNEEVRSVNAVVGETNDGTLNDIRARHVTPADAIARDRSRRAKGRCRKARRRRHRHHRVRLERRDRHQLAQASGEPRRLDGRRAGADQLRRSPAGRGRAGRPGARPILSEGRAVEGERRRIVHRRDRDRRAAVRPQPRAARPSRACSALRAPARR